VVGGAARAEVARVERTSRYQVARAFADSADEREALAAARGPRRLSLDEAHHRRGGELATVVSDPDRRCVIEMIEGRDRRTIERWLSALPADVRAGIEVDSIDPYDAIARRSERRCRTRGSSATPSTSFAAPTRHWMRCVASVSARRVPAGPRACVAAGSTRPGAPNSSAPDTGCLWRVSA
jgi:Transposase